MARLDQRIAILILSNMNQQHTSPPSNSEEPSFVSQQVTDARRFYLDLNPSRKAQFTVVCGGVERMRPEYIVSRKDFPYFAVELVTEGEGRLTLDGHKSILTAGSVFAYGPGVAHTIQNQSTHPMRKYYFDFWGRESASLLEATGLAIWKPLRISAIHELIDLFESLIREAREDTAIGHSICQSLARLLLLKIQQRSVPAGRNVPRSLATYERIRRHVEQNFLTLQTVEDVAQASHITPMYVSRLFRRFGGTGAYQFLLRLRMNYAAELLLEDGLLVKQVAHKMGFADAFQFSRAFKRVHGVAPSQVLQSQRRS